MSTIEAEALASSDSDATTMANGVDTATLRSRLQAALPGVDVQEVGVRAQLLAPPSTAPITPPPDDDGRDSWVPVIVGASVGGVCFIALCLGALYLFMRKQRPEEPKQPASATGDVAFSDEPKVPMAQRDLRGAGPGAAGQGVWESPSDAFREVDDPLEVERRCPPSPPPWSRVHRARKSV